MKGVNRYIEPVKEVTGDTVNWELKKRKNAFDLRFIGNEYGAWRESFQVMRRTMKAWKRVRNMEAGCERSKILKSKDIETLSEGLKQLSCLQSLNLDFQSSCGTITDESLKNLGEGLKRLNPLQSLNLNFGTCDITNEGLKDLSKGLKRHGCLKAFSLDVSYCEKITDKGLTHLIQSLKRFNSLNSINLNLFGCRRASDFSYKTLGEVLKRLENSLQVIQHRFNNWITERGLKDFSQGLKSLHSLQSINFNLTGCTFTDEDMENFSQDLNSLKHIKIKLHWCENITGKSLTSLSDALKNLGSLLSVNLDFSIRENLTDECLKHLGEGLKRLKSLQSIDLSFRSYDNGVTNEGLKNLGEGLQSLTSLEYISLNFYWCKKVTDEGMQALYQNLRRLNKIGQLKSIKIQ